MRWQIAQFVFCDQQQTLTSTNECVQLEPMMVALISYFCQNTDQIVSKDLLIEQVWLGRIVSDNAVSKLITKLRKVFNDDARQPKFIATFPKKGYKFIAHVKAINDEKYAIEVNENSGEFIGEKVLESKLSADQKKLVKTISQDSAENVVQVKGKAETFKQAITEESQPAKAKDRRTIYLLVLVIIILLISFYKPWQQDNKLPSPSTHTKELTTDAGDEVYPDFSPDGSRVVYMSVQNGQMHLTIKNVADDAMVEISHGENVGVGPASWSRDGNFIAYLAATPQECQYYIRAVNGLELGEPKLIHNCPAGSYGRIAFSHDNNRLIYAENSGANTPYSLFEINLTNDQIKRLNQPEMFLAGNSQFDLHPTENKLLISSPDKQQWEGFYSLDLQTEQLTLLFKQNAYICCGIWSHSGERVVLMGEHPAHQLLSYDLSGNDMQVVHSGSRQIRSPRRHVNESDYLFSSGKDNYNVKLIDLLTKKERVIVNDSVDERLAVFAHHNNQIAYIGLASGNEEVWLTNSEKNQRKKLTEFNDSRHYVDLIWSPDGRYLLALTLNEIHLINAETGSFERLKIPQTEIKAISFKSAETITYSVKVNNQWQVYAYQLASGKVLAEDKKWQFIQYQIAGDNTLWLDQKNTLYSGELPTPVIDQKVPIEKLIYGRQFNLTKRGHQWYWFERDDQGKIQGYSEKSDELTSITFTETADFDVAKNKLLFGDVQQLNSNIYQTQASPRN